MMKNYIKIISVLMVLQFSATAQERYQLDVKKSRLLWDIKSVGKHFGHILFKNGRLDYDAKGNPSVGFFVMDMKAIRSEDGKTQEDRAKVDKRLLEPDFFEVAKYPTAIMDVKQIRATAEANIYSISGNLTIRGISQPIEFSSKFQKKGNTILANGKLGINRKIWHIHYKPDFKSMDFFASAKDKLMADDISISFNLIFSK